jgi:5-phospho-D-xylono-1,4-lactonase
VNLVRTVLGDISPEDLGVAFCHEHLIIDSPLVADRFPHIHLPSVADAIREVGICAGAGVTAMVDAMPCAAGRSAPALAEISRATGVHVIATTGLHTDRYYAGADWIHDASSKELADLFTADVEEGIDRYDYRGPPIRRTEHRAGIVKGATLGDRPDPRERTVFEAVAATHHATGAPIITHCEEGAGGPAQVELFVSLGVPPDRVLLSHTDKRSDVGYHRELLASGVNLEYDQSLRRAPDEGRGTAWLLSEMLSEGYGSQLMLGTDGARRSLWSSLGGEPGLAWLYTGFVEVLEARGIDAAARRALFVDNPARFLAFDPARNAL